MAHSQVELSTIHSDAVQQHANQTDTTNTRLHADVEQYMGQHTSTQLAIEAVHLSVQAKLAKGEHIGNVTADQAAAMIDRSTPLGKEMAEHLRKYFGPHSPRTRYIRDITGFPATEKAPA